MNRRSGDTGRKNPQVKVIRVIRNGGKRVTALISKNGGQTSRVLFLENTSGNNWKDQFGHPYEIERTLLA